MQYSLVGSEDGTQNITVFIPGNAPLVAHSSHPNFKRILDHVLNVEGVATADFPSLFDVAKAVSDKFEHLSDRVTVSGGHLFLDGVEVHNELSAQVVRFLSEGVEDWKPLVNFFENVQNNPQEHSREQLFTWLKGHDFTITNDGFIVGYKGVTARNGEYFSIHSGMATVDGVVHSGQIPNKLGSVVEMPRDQVTFDPSHGCSQGLHVGTYDFAKGFSQGAVLELHVNPRDVVSIPTDSGAQKMRVCRYRVVSGEAVEHTRPVVDDWEYTDYDEEEERRWVGDDFEDQEDSNPVEDDGSIVLGNGTVVSAIDVLDAAEEIKSYEKSQVIPKSDGKDRPIGEILKDLADEAKEHFTSTGTKPAIKVGDVFKDRDVRRNRTVIVLTVGDSFAKVKSEPSNIVSTLGISRLLDPSRFKKVA